MSVKNALKFIQLFGDDPRLKKDLQDLGPAAEISDIIALGAREGLDFSPEEFRAAFSRDWQMRRVYFTGEKKR